MSIVTLIGLAVAIVIAAINALTAGRLDPIDPLWPTNPSVMGYWVGDLGWIPTIAALGAMIIGFRKSGVGVSILTFFAALVGLVVTICVLVAVVAATYPKPAGGFPLAVPGAERDAFMRSATDSCFKKQRPSTANSALSDAVIQKFCRCVAEAVASQTTREDLAYQQKNSTFSPAMASRITQAAASCAQDQRK